MKIRHASAVAALAAVVAFAPTAAQAAEVTVSATTISGARTVYVENLRGDPLQSLEFGASRAQPFRVRVVDETMSRSNFSVSASMSSLYLAQGDAVDFGTPIASSNLGLAYPNSPLDVKSVSAVVAPVLDLAGTITGPTCAVLQTLRGTSSCEVSMPAVKGAVQNLTVPVDLSNLAKLPLIPQAGVEGTFDKPAYAGVAATAPRPAPAPAATQLEVLSGTAASDLVLAPLDTALTTLVNATPTVALVDDGTLTLALRDALGATVFGALNADQVNVILATVKATAKALTGTDILAQSGTYLSFPVLELDVPLTAPGGLYKGTLVVSALQG